MSIGVARSMGFSTSCEPVASGTRRRVSSDPPAPCTGIFRNGRRRVCSFDSGKRLSGNTMRWKGSIGAGRAWMGR